MNTSARLLRLLALLSARPSVTCGELAGQLSVTDRTIRRDISRLRELGYVIESEPGPWGGYRLGRGTSLPPLILDDDEALAVAVGLRAAAFSGVSGSDQAALSAMLKLRQVLPARMVDRLGELDDVFTLTPAPDERQIAPDLLFALATACRRGERLQLSYRDRSGTVTGRQVDPYRLVYTGRRWYFVAYDLTRQQWRTFRGDRVLDARPTGERVDLVDPPDPAELVSQGIAGRPYPASVTIRLPLPADAARRLIPPTVGVHRPDDSGAGGAIVEIGGPDADGLARYLLSLGTPLRILHPEQVRQAFQRRLRELAEANRTAEIGAGPAEIEVKGAVAAAPTN
jgi:predicted DNA-binding transcriptional regulator YafY